MNFLPEVMSVTSHLEFCRNMAGMSGRRFPHLSGDRDLIYFKCCGQNDDIPNLSDTLNGHS